MPDTPDSGDLQALATAVRQVAETAAVRILEVYGGDFEVHRKADDSPVTAADIAAHDVIVEGLMRIDPGTPIISEESVLPEPGERQQWSTLWIVDPLDGTRGFVDRSGEFCINIALVEAGTPILGIVHVPISGECYFAARGSGAFKAGRGQPPRRICAARRASSPLRIAVSRSRSNARLRAFLHRFPTASVARVGSAIKSCLVAEGRVDLYPCFGETSQWDTAAAQCVVQQAGGYFTDFNMQTLSYNQDDSLTNPGFVVFADADQSWREFLPQ